VAWLRREEAALASNASCALHGGTVRRTSQFKAKTSKEQGVIRSNILYLVVGVLVVVVAVLGYQLYQDRKQPEGMRIDVGPNGLSIEKK
jgi:RsiW-degrading membrane proteinase PrsW (M82 family)